MTPAKHPCRYPQARFGWDIQYYSAGYETQPYPASYENKFANETDALKAARAAAKAAQQVR